MNWGEIDYAVIKTYDNTTGWTYLDRLLDHYHWGAPQSTGSYYQGIDMRGEVVLLTRNIKIVGNSSEDWGCQVLTGDFVEGIGVNRTGITILDYVEVYNCSQYDTYKGALRWEGAN